MLKLTDREMQWKLPLYTHSDQEKILKWLIPVGVEDGRKIKLYNADDLTTYFNSFKIKTLHSAVPLLKAYLVELKKSEPRGICT